MKSTVLLLMSIAVSTPVFSQEKLGPSPVGEIGVYFQRDGKWIDLPPEVINWKSGGILKEIGTAFIVKGDLNGRIRGGSSRTHLNQPTELLVYATEGTAITEYQLLKLRTHSNSREFRTVTGGVLHVSGGSERDLLEFEGKHIAQRSWTISLENLKPGEYGLMPPGVSESRSASAQLGKIYTFSIPNDEQHTPETRERPDPATTPTRTAPGGEAPLLGVEGYASESGFKITSVRAGSPAGQIYLKAGDVIVRIDGRDVHNSHDIEAAIAASASGTAKLSFLTQTGLGTAQSEREVKVR